MPGCGASVSGALSPPTARPLGGLPGPTTHWLWVRGGEGVGTRHQPHSACSCELALRAVGAARGRPGGAPPAWVWGVRGRALFHPRLPALWAGCRGPLPTGCGCGGVRASGPVTNPTARALACCGGGMRAPGGGRLLPGCGASGVGRTPTPNRPPSGRAAGAHYPLAVGAGGCGLGDPSPTPQRALLRAGFARYGNGTRVPRGGASCLGVGRPGSGALPPPTARPLGGLPGLTTHWLWMRGVAGVGTCHQPHRARSCELALRAVGAARGRPRGGASCLCVGCPEWGALPPPTARPLGGLPGPTTHRLSAQGAAVVPRVCACACPAWLVRPPPGWGCPVCGCWWVVLFPFPFSPSLRPRCVLLCVFSGPGCLGPWRLVAPTPPFCFFCSFFPFPPSVRPVVSCFVCFPAWGALGLCVLLPPPPSFCVCCHVVLCCGALSSFFVFLPAGGAGFLLFPVGSGLRVGWVVSVSVLCLCGAVLACLRRCCLFGALLPSRGWLVFCVVACCVCVFAVGPGCPLSSPGGSWWLLVSCLGGVLWCVPGCCAAPCCCALCCCALCCLVLLRLVLAARCVVPWGAVRRLGVLCVLAPCFVLSPRAVCVLLWCVAAWCCSPLCFVPCAPWGVVLCVSCRLRPVRCCCVARSPSVPCSPVLCLVVLC